MYCKLEFCNSGVKFSNVLILSYNIMYIFRIIGWFINEKKIILRKAGKNNGFKN